MAEQALTGPVTSVLEALTHTTADDRVSVRQIARKMGERSFAPLLLVPAMLLVSPISSIPGAPTTGGLIIALITVQMLMGRRHIWLPGFLANRTIGTARLNRAVRYLRGPAAWVDQHVHHRLSYLATRPLSYIALLTCLLVTVIMPLMEVVPMLATVAASAVTLFAIGLLTYDGAFIVAGYVFVGAGVALAGMFI
ncbi:MAG: exopolysaccharide biosynthesis protein [Paracoccaceae bacterium]